MDFLKLKVLRDFPGGPVVKNLPCNAGDASSIPGRGTKIPHAVEQLSPRATTTEAERHNGRVQPVRCNEDPTRQRRSCVPQPSPGAAK